MASVETLDQLCKQSLTKKSTNNTNNCHGKQFLTWVIFLTSSKNMKKINIIMEFQDWSKTNKVWGEGLMLPRYVPDYETSSSKMTTLSTVAPIHCRTHHNGHNGRCEEYSPHKMTSPPSAILWEHNWLYLLCNADYEYYHSNIYSQSWKTNQMWLAD